MTTSTTPVSFQTYEVAGTRDCAHDLVSWSDAQLIALVRSDPPDEKALEVLVARYWASAFAHCQMLTLNREKALDLAQEAWYRVLQHRHALKTDGNFRAYLVTIATNLFRDSYRAARRAGPIGEGQLMSLDVSMTTIHGEKISFANILPDLKSLHGDEMMRIKLDIDVALGQLTPLLREVLLARYIEGYSCAEIGIHHGRKEQTVSGWVRKALRLMNAYLQVPEPQASHPSRCQPCHPCEEAVGQE